MKITTKTWVATVALGMTALMLGRPDAQAADHVDAPTVTEDAAGDITDFYAWHVDNRVVAAIAFAGLDAPGGEGTYADDIRYGIHIDNNADNEADQTVWAQFGQADDGSWGVRFEGIPGGMDEVVGPVNEALDAGLGLSAFAGVRDDPFFFDLDGFNTTLMTGTLSFNPDNDTFAATNVTMIIVELPIDGIAAGSDDIAMWATTYKKVL